MIKHRHAIRTEDESIWIEFDGDVPRKGEFISITEPQVKKYELDKSFSDKVWIVYKVLWFSISWRVEPYPSNNQEVVTISQARVYIKEDTGEICDE